MRIKIKAFGLLREIIKDENVEIEKNSSLEKLLLSMAEKYKKPFEKQVFNPTTKNDQ